MQFAHLSDTHLGYKQYGLVDRENDFLEVFNQAIDEVIGERPDFTIHSGDLFEFSRPPTKALMTAQDGFLRLKEAGVPVYAVAGNHDVVMRRNAVPPHILFKQFGMKLISPNHPSYVHGDVFIGGAPYASKYNSKQLIERLNLIEESAMDYKKRVLVLHQGIDKYLPVDFELKIGDLPTGFNYYAMGHIHDRIVDDLGDGVLAYPGSTEIWRFNEVDDYLKNGKGFYLVDMGGDIPEVERIDLKLPRELIKRSIMFNEFKDALAELVSHIQGLDKPPVAMVTVKGGNLNRSEVYETLNMALADICLSVRSKYKPTIEGHVQIQRGDDALTIDGLIEERLSEFKSEELTKLGTGLVKELADGDVQVAAAMVDTFFEGAY